LNQRSGLRHRSTRSFSPITNPSAAVVSADRALATAAEAAAEGVACLLPLTIASTARKFSSANETGGTFFEVSGKRTLSDIYDRIEDDLRNQYSLGFAPDANAAGYRRIRLTAKQKGLVVTAREGYYAN
jgi:VWFA-related protein